MIMVHQGITDLIDLLEHFNSDDSSLKGVDKAFLSTGCAPTATMNEYDYSISISFTQCVYRIPYTNQESTSYSIEQTKKLNIMPSNAQPASSSSISNPNNDDNDYITSISREEYIDSFEPSSDIEEY